MKMKFECEDFIPLIHKTFGTAGCYGCENATLNVDFTWCSEGHWCMPMLVPMMEDGSDGFGCVHHRPEDETYISLCNDCKLLNNHNDRCSILKELRNIVVRFN